MNEHTKIRVVNFFLDFLLSFFFYFIKRKKNRIIFMSSYLGDYTSNSKFLFEDLINQDIGYELKFVVNDEHLRKSLEERLGKHFISNKTLKEKIYILNAKYWVCSYFDMPVQGIFLSFRRIVLHLGHGIPVNRVRSRTFSNHLE
ncbi:hypothetical protein DA100_15715 [Vibrio sp. Hep-1b-8]|nr:hypothetical protein DA100_15715 [Vibrio sp. Hep-1b-8]